jgi:hypothetical protein
MMVRSEDDFEQVMVDDLRRNHAPETDLGSYPHDLVLHQHFVHQLEFHVFPLLLKVFSSCQSTKLSQLLVSQLVDQLLAWVCIAINRFQFVYQQHEQFVHATLIQYHDVDLTGMRCNGYTLPAEESLIADVEIVLCRHVLAGKLESRTHTSETDIGDFIKVRVNSSFLQLDGWIWLFDFVLEVLITVNTLVGVYH